MKTDPKTEPKEIKRNDVHFVWLGFNDASTNFVVTFHSSDFDLLKLAVIAVGEYNEFKDEQVVPVIEKIEHLARHISFGREGSPVLFVHLKNKADAPKVVAAFQNAKVDECSISCKTILKNSFDAKSLDSETTVRPWWD